MLGQYTCLVKRDFLGIKQYCFREKHKNVDSLIISSNFETIVDF